MLSFQTCVELVSVLERMVTSDLDRLFQLFDMDHLLHEFYGKKNSSDKGNLLLKQLKNPPDKGPYTDNFQLDMLQYKVNQFYRYEEDKLGLTTYNVGTPIPFEHKFANKHKSLSRFLKKDGYIIVGREIRKLLPEEIQEARTESELFRLLDQFRFSLAKEHLVLGRDSLTSNNWSGANAQFRNFTETLLINICNHVLPNNECTSPTKAITLLGNTANPPFLSAELNEIEYANFKHPFVESLWKRLHPQGSHPGLSDEEDATFRYQITVVFAYYLLNRLNKR